MGTLSVITRCVWPLVSNEVIFRLVDWRIFLSGASVDLWMTYGGTVSSYLVRFFFVIPFSLLRRSATNVVHDQALWSPSGQLRTQGCVWFDCT